MNPQEELIQWLLSLPQIRDPKPITIRIENVEYLGAKYTVVGHYTSGMMAVTHGDKKAGEEYTDENFYFLGERPKSHLKKKAKDGVCYIGPNQDTFYVSCYMGKKEYNACPQAVRDQYHPLGPNFMLGIWPEKLGEIDAHEDKPYRRIPMSMSTLTN